MSQRHSPWHFAKKLIPPSFKTFIRRSLRRPAPCLPLCQATLKGKRGLELGGPSEIFRDEGALPIYRSVAQLDNCLYSDRTLWTGAVKSADGFLFHPSKQKGRQYICDASELGSIPAADYDFVLASHCLEHIANPLRALAEWKRVLKPGGSLLVVLPHKECTFDWKRPTTALSHMVGDFEKNVQEDDLSHLQEILALHDLQRDPAAGDKEQFRQRCLQNATKRAMHHHVFDTYAAALLVNRAGFHMIDIAPVKPFHIVILAANSPASPDNSRFLETDLSYLAKSPFRVDRDRLESVSRTAALNSESEL